MKTLFVLLGPTGVGKTENSLSIAHLLHSPILGADSRQLYYDLPIGTAAPTIEERNEVRHYFVGTLALEDYYSAAQYEHDAIELLTKLFDTHTNILLTGGSMLYIDAVCKGIDEIPTVDEITRQTLQKRLQNEGLESLTEELKDLDPTWYNHVDLKNPRRVLHALEICHMTAMPYSSFLGAKQTKRPFRIIKIGLQLPREELYQRINNRVDQMMQQGLLEEAQRVFPKKDYNSLNTVGYKELFNYFEGKWTLEEAVEKIKRSTRIYARKQMMWFNNDSSVFWFRPNKTDKILHFVSDISSS